MIDLKKFVQDRGFTVAHIKTDSIKIPNATPEIIRDVTLFGEKYGYTFEHEDTFKKFCLVNDAVYVAWSNKNEKWTVKGAQFQHPYVFKTLFSKEPLSFENFCETKEVKQGAIYMDFEHERAAALVEGMHFIGRTGRFVPVKPGNGGAILYRAKDDKTYAVTGTKGYLWLEENMARELGEDVIDMTYFERLAAEAERAIDFYGPFTEFVS
jgi:hypothetical protein